MQVSVFLARFGLRARQGALGAFADPLASGSTQTNRGRQNYLPEKTKETPGVSQLPRSTVGSPNPRFVEG
jgi:hypothetical protein